MTATLVLLRHGESEWNAKNLFTGWVDVGLSEKGRAEAVRGGQLLGEAGLRRLAEVNHARAVQVAERLAAIPGVELVNDSFFNEFTIRLPIEARPAVHALAQKGVLGGVSLGRLYPEAEALANGLVIAVTETVTDADVDALEAALKEIVQ